MHNTPDVTLAEKKELWIIDVAISGNSRTQDKNWRRT